METPEIVKVTVPSKKNVIVRRALIVGGVALGIIVAGALALKLSNSEETVFEAEIID